MRYAQVIEGIVVNVFESDAPDPLPDDWVATDVAGPGWSYAGGVFTPPEDTSEPFVPLVGVGDSGEAAAADLTGSFTTQASATITALGPRKIMVFFFWSGYAYRATGTGQMGVEVQVRRGATNISPATLPVYFSGGASGAVTTAGCATWWHAQSVPAGTTTFSVVARFISGTTSAQRSHAKVQVFDFPA
jgi:hypothetical protein